MTNYSYLNAEKIPDYREYLQIKLTRPLNTGKTYYFEYYAQFRDNSSIAAGNLGALFTVKPDTSADPKNFSALIRSPQVNHPGIIDGTKKWTKVSGCFEAKAQYHYLTIGNFIADSQTSFLPTIWLTGIEPYYLIDDVLLEETSIDFLPPANLLGNDTTICEGQQLNFDFSPLQGYDFTWQGGSKEKIFTSATDGTYALRLTNGKCVILDTIALKVINKVKLGPDLRFCAEQELKLSSPSGDTLLWQDGTITNEYTVSATGQYVASSLSPQCPSSDTVSVEKLSCPGMIPNVITPNGDGKNDFFVIENIDLLSWELTIYNRWGKQVYENVRYDNSWKGSGLSAGSYYYLLRNHTLNQSYKGWVTILL